VPPGVAGTVVDVRVFNRRRRRKATSARMQIERDEIEQLMQGPRRRDAPSSSVTRYVASARRC